MKATRSRIFSAAVFFITFLSGTQPAPAQQHLISTFAGGAPPATPVPATTASIGVPSGVAIDGAGNLFFVGGQCVFKVDGSGTLTRVAGNSRRGYSGDGGPANNAQLRGPFGVAVDTFGNLYIADELNQRIRRVSPSGIISTVAGNGVAGFSGDGGPATDAELNNPLGVSVDSAGNIYIADSSNNRIREVSPNGIISTVAGAGVGIPGDDTYTGLNGPSSMALDAAGNLYIADRDNMRVEKVTPGGIITTVAGNGTQGSSGDGGPAASAQLYLPTGVTLDTAGNLYIADFANGRIRKVSPGGLITTYAALSQSSEPSGVATDTAGNVFFTDEDLRAVQSVSAAGGVTTIAGNGIESFGGDGGPATAAQMNLTNGVAVDASGNVYIADLVNSNIRKVSPQGIISTLAVNVLYPAGLAVDASGNLYIADNGNNRIVKASPDGTVQTVAGSGGQGFSGDGGPAISAQLNRPAGVAVDGAGNIYIADSGNVRVRKVSSAGVISTFAGGDSGISLIIGLVGVSVDTGGNVYIADGDLLRVSPGGVVTRVFANAGTGPIAVDGFGNIYAAGTGTVLLISSGGISATIAGNGTSGGYAGDGGPATGAQLNLPGALAVDVFGNVYVADYANFAIRLLQPAVQPLIGAVVDSASERTEPVSPGKIVTIYGAGLGPGNPAGFVVGNGIVPTQLAGTTVEFNGIAAPIIYTSATQVSAVVPYSSTGSVAQVTVGYQGQASASFAIPLASSSPSLFTANGTGAGPAAAINVASGALNSALSPVHPGEYISLYATGEGQTTPPGIDGKVTTLPLPQPNLPVTATVGGFSATVQYAGGAPGNIAGLMQVNIRIPDGVQPGGYVPIVLKVGDASTPEDAVWIAVAAN
jgi:trimeric autotransporter adhesin